MNHRQMSGKKARKRRTVIDHELLEFLKVELLLSTSSTHFLYSNLFVHNLSDNALKCEQEKTHKRQDLWIQGSVSDSKCLPIDLCGMHALLLEVGHSQSVMDNFWLTCVPMDFSRQQDLRVVSREKLVGLTLSICH